MDALSFFFNCLSLIAILNDIDSTVKQNSMEVSRSRIQNSSLGGEGVSQYFRDSTLMLKPGFIITCTVTMILVPAGMLLLIPLALMGGLIFIHMQDIIQSYILILKG